MMFSNLPTLTYTPILLTLIHSASYLLTGVISSILTQLLAYKGITNHTTLLLPLTSYLGMWVVRFLPEGFLGGDFDVLTWERDKLNKAELSVEMSSSDGDEGHHESDEFLVSNKRDNVTNQRHKTIEQNPISSIKTSSPPTSSTTLATSDNPIKPPSPPLLKSPKKQPKNSPPNTLHIPYPICTKLKIPTLTTILILLDFIGTIISLTSLTLLGSGLQLTIMSSVVIWAALFSYIFLGRRIGMQEGGWLVVIVGGLSGAGLSQKYGDHGSVEDHEIDSTFNSSVSFTDVIDNTSIAGGHKRIEMNDGQLYIGLTLALSASLIFSLNYILAETIQTKTNSHIQNNQSDTSALKTTAEQSNLIKPFNSKALCSVIGLRCTQMSLVYMLFWTIPNFEVLIGRNVKDTLLESLRQEQDNLLSDFSSFPVDNVNAFAKSPLSLDQQTSAASAISSSSYESSPSFLFSLQKVYLTLFFYALILIASHSLHMLSYFYLLRTSGSLHIGVLKAVQSILVFGVSAAMFCSVQSSQCANFWRVASSLVVAGGVFGYGVVKAGGGGKGKSDSVKWKKGRRESV